MIDRLDFASALARDAGKLAHSAFGTSTSSLKGRHDIVTEMDAKVERFIKAAIHQRYPGDGFVGEEESAGGDDRGAANVWVVDPIDGTANYARGIPHYCVSIGYLERGVPTLGVIYDPCHDWLYAAALGSGATRDGARMSVSRCADAGAATVECGWSTRRDNADYLRLIERVFAAGCVVRRAGSGALGLVDVAAGRVESYCELHTNAWDAAAGIVLVREAGGRTNDFFAGEGLARGNALIATNAALSDTLSAVIGIPITN